MLVVARSGYLDEPIGVFHISHLVADNLPFFVPPPPSSPSPLFLFREKVYSLSFLLFYLCFLWRSRIGHAVERDGTQSAGCWDQICKIDRKNTINLIAVKFGQTELS